MTTNAYTSTAEERAGLAWLLQHVGEDPRVIGCTDAFMAITIARAETVKVGHALSDEYAKVRERAPGAWREADRMRILEAMVVNEAHYEDIRACWMANLPSREKAL